MARARQRWLPALLIPLALILAVIFGSVQAGATVPLPPRTADEILAMIAQSEVRTFSGTMEQTAELGLPAVPSVGPGMSPGAASALEFLTGSHTARVYAGGAHKVRLQIMDPLAERDIVVNGKDAWFYNSADNSATHLTAPASAAEARETSPTRPAQPDMPTPQAMASRFLAAIDASTEVTVGDASSVAGRSAYRLNLLPRSAATLVESVSIDVDSETGVPLGVQLRAKGQADPAYSLAFTDLNLSTPDAGLFEFTPPAGATVTEKALPAKPEPTMQLPAEPVPDTAVPAPEASAPSDAASPVTPRHGATVTGEDWDSIVALPAGTAPADLTSNPQFSQALQAVAGGKALATSLVSVLILDDGRIYAGMVPLDRLESAAAAR